VKEVEKTIEKVKEGEVNEEEVNATVTFKPIDKLLEYPGITKKLIERLKGGGFHTIESIAFSTKKALGKIYGVGEETINKILKIAHELTPMNFSNAFDVWELRKNMVIITTGSTALDKILEGGIECGYITEMFGEFGTGKTQLCHQLCVTCQLPFERGGGQGRALVIDTEGTFRPERCAEIALRYDLVPEDILRNIAYARAYNSDHQYQLVCDAAKMFAESRYALLIVDSATAHFRTDYVGRSELSERQGQLALFMRKLMGLAIEFGVAVVVTNQVVSNPSGNVMYGNDKTPIGGNIMAHASTTRLQFRKKGHNIICKVYDSPNLAQVEGEFQITKDGIQDPETDTTKKQEEE